jgi:hypothetical protein
MRGSIGGTTFSRGMGGATARHRVKGVHPASPLQNAVKARQSLLAVAWSKTLSASQRLAWRDWATSTTWTNRLGATITITGLDAFIASNSIRMLDGSNYAPDAPTVPGHAGAAPLTANIVGGVGDVVITACGGTWGPTTGNDIVHVFASAPASKGVLMPKRRIRYIGSFEGSVGGTPIPVTLSLGFVPAAGQPVAIESVHIDELHRPGNREKLLVIPS